jgi:hypothetical protein
MGKIARQWPERFDLFSRFFWRETFNQHAALALLPWASSMARWNNSHSTANFIAFAGQQLPHGVAGVNVSDQNFCGSNDAQSRTMIP